MKGVRQEDRTKFWVRLSPTAAAVVDDVVVRAGVSRNSFVVLAILHGLLEVAKALRVGDVLDRIEVEFAAALAEARTEKGATARAKKKFGT